jgi:lysyl-tRNA synthetase class 2
MSHEDSDNKQVSERRQKLAELRKRGNAYPNDFARTALAADLHKHHDNDDAEQLGAGTVHVCVAGRMMTRRIHGKSSFADIQDVSGRIQLYLPRERLGDGLYSEFKQWDLGDIVGAGGTLFKSRTGELTIRVEAIRLLTKALRPLPEKYHGLVDQEWWRHR